MAVVSGGAPRIRRRWSGYVELFEAVGDALVVDEAVQDAATAISGSGPAYVALFVDALAEAGAAQGLEREVALRLAVQTFKGTAELLLASGMEPQELIEARLEPRRHDGCCPGGSGGRRLPADCRRGRLGRRAARKGAGLVSVMGIILRLIDFYEMLIIVYVLMSWFRPSSGILYDAYAALGTVVEPWVGIFRRIVPLFGMIDFSPLVAILVLQLIQRLLSSLL